MTLNIKTGSIPSGPQLTKSLFKADAPDWSHSAVELYAPLSPLSGRTCGTAPFPQARSTLHPKLKMINRQSASAAALALWLDVPHTYSQFLRRWFLEKTCGIIAGTSILEWCVFQRARNERTRPGGLTIYDSFTVCRDEQDKLGVRPSRKGHSPGTARCTTETTLLLMSEYRQVCSLR